MASLGFDLNRLDIFVAYAQCREGRIGERLIAGGFRVNCVRIYFYKICNFITFTLDHKNTITSI